MKASLRRFGLIRDGFFSAFSLLTRLPVPAHHHQGAASAWAWPLVGLVIGGIAASTLLLGGWLGIAPGPAAVIVLAVMALLTGGLHEDGLSDSADGLLGGGDPARRLEIMKDSRIGSFGALALLLVTLAAWSALERLITLDRALSALLAASALSRATMALLMTALPPARENGLAAGLGRPSPAVALLSLALGLAICALLLEPREVIAACLATLIAGLFITASAWRLIGGQTGDILGAGQQLAFAAILTALT